MKKEQTIRIKHLVIPKEEASRINKLLKTSSKRKNECFTETITHTADFGDGFEMHIRLCGVRFDKDRDNLPRAEALLCYHGCTIVQHTGPFEYYFGEWELYYEGTIYRVIVEEGKTEESVPMKTYLVACDLGCPKIQTYIIKVPDSYIPSSDNMALIRESIIKDFAPDWHHAYTMFNECSGSLNVTSTHRKIEYYDLKIIALSRLDI